MMKRPLVLCILDGCGIRKEKDGNAFYNANKPTINYLLETYPNCLLEASGKSVGLPNGQMGNSEVGHTNIGAGKIVFQPLELINNAIENNELYNNEEILKLVDHINKNNSTLHLMGLLSDGGVHSHINHLLSLIDLLKEKNISNVCYHLFLDGRDVAPKSAEKYIDKLAKKIEETNVGKIVSISGRYYAMDRDNNYDRVNLAYDAIVNGIGKKYKSISELFEINYSNNITDEFILPSLLNDSVLNDNDAIMTFNFRPDRLRELFTAFTNYDNTKVNIKRMDKLKVLTMFPVTDEVLCPSVFKNQDSSDYLGEVLEKNNLKQLRIAETEKYAHVTYFFDGGEEKEYDGMNKILISSPKVATYDMKPEMSAKEVTDTLLNEIDKDIYDVIILNYANGDMVGHTGDYQAAKKAIEFLDVCLRKLYDKVEEKNGILIITADHGNCDIMWDENKNPITSHTTSKVPFIITKKDIMLKDGNLSNIAPTILELLGINKPNKMTSESLIIK